MSSNKTVVVTVISTSPWTEFDMTNIQTNQGEYDITLQIHHSMYGELVFICNNSFQDVLEITNLFTTPKHEINYRRISHDEDGINITL